MIALTDTDIVALCLGAFGATLFLGGFVNAVASWRRRHARR